MPNQIETAIATVSQKLKLVSEELAVLRALNEALKDCPELTDVLIVWADLGITFYLRPESRDSLLPAVIAERLGIRLTRIAQCDSLGVVGTWRGSRLTITNYLPANCRVEKTIVELPESQWTKTRTIFQVVCQEAQDEH